MIYSRGFSAFLFDMDGTLVNSHPVVERVWGGWLRKHGLDVDRILPSVHGVRIADTVRRLAVSGVDPDEEAARITMAETEDVEGILPIAGAREFFHALSDDRRAIVTSATLEMARRRLAAAGVEVPTVLVTGRDVRVGKPAPDFSSSPPRSWPRTSRVALCSRTPMRASWPPKRRARPSSS